MVFFNSLQKAPESRAVYTGAEPGGKNGHSGLDRAIRMTAAPILTPIGASVEKPVMMRHTGVLCLLLLLMWPAAGSAQQGSVRGSVVDQTGLVLPSTTVTLRGDGGPRTVSSDERGHFELVGIAPGTYTLTVSLAGFSDATVDSVVVPDGELALPPVVLQLATFGDTVVVTASRNEVRLIDAPVSTSVISTATLDTTPAQNYGDLLRATPGVNVIQLSARDVQVSSRSPGNTLTNSQLVLVDGRSAYLDFFGLVLWDLLPTNFADVEQIEVVRGPASAVWGANAMTGAVNRWRGPPRGGRVPAGRDLLGAVPPGPGRAGGQVRQPVGSEVLAAHRVHRQASGGSLRHAVVQPGVPYAVGHQQRAARTSSARWT